MSKICSRCKKEKPLEEFKHSKRNVTTKMCGKCRGNSKKYDFRRFYNAEIVYKGGQKLCERCMKYKDLNEYKRKDLKHCDECRAKHKCHWDRNEKNCNNRRVNFYISLKKGKSCVDCGESDYRVLEFDHQPGFKKIGMVVQMTNIEDMAKEAAKCEMRCGRCHAIRTHSNKKPKEIYSDKRAAQWGVRKRKKTRSLIDNKKLEIGKCELCGWFDKKHLYSLHFDHLDRTTKFRQISCMIHEREEKILEEIAKCRLLCVNCHKLHTNKQMGYLTYKNVEY